MSGEAFGTREGDTIRFERRLPGPIDRVWAYLVEGDKRATWLAGGTTEPREGGKVTLVFDHSQLTQYDETPPKTYAEMTGPIETVGEVIRWEPPHLLAYSWTEEDGEPSEVEFRLADDGGDVLLTLTHRRLRTHRLRTGVAAGWHTHLSILGERLRGEEPGPFWERHTAIEAEYERRLS